MERRPAENGRAEPRGGGRYRYPGRLVCDCLSPYQDVRLFSVFWEPYCMFGYVVRIMPVN